MQGSAEISPPSALSSPHLVLLITEYPLRLPWRIVLRAKQPKTSAKSMLLCVLRVHWEERERPAHPIVKPLAMDEGTYSRTS